MKMEESCKVRQALALRARTDIKYNCCQAMVLPFAEEFGLPAEEIRRMTANIGGGLRMGATCGAVCGGVMVLGLFGIQDPAVVKEYYAAVRERIGDDLNCAELLRKNEERGGEKKPFCDALIADCMRLTEEFLAARGLYTM